MESNEKEEIEKLYKKYEVIYKYSSIGYMHNKLQQYIDSMIEQQDCA